MQQLNLTPQQYPQQIKLIGINATAPISITHFVQANGLLNQLAIIPNSTKSLIATTSFTNQGLTVIYNKTTVHVVTQQQQVIVEGTVVNGFWRFNLQELIDHPGITQAYQVIPELVLNATISPHTQQELVDYCHIITGRPPLRTFRHMINNNFIRNFFPITIAMITKYPPDLLATSRGHDKLIAKRTKKSRPTPPTELDDDDEEPCEEDIAFADTNEIHMYRVFDLEAEEPDVTTPPTLFQDATGPFPTPAASGARNIAVFLYEGYVHLVPINAVSAAELTRATEETVDFLLARNKAIGLNVLDNTCPQLLRQALRSRGIKFQLVAPRNHRYNRAEFAINIVKSRYITMKADIDPDFDMKRWWDLLMPRLEININISLPSPTNPRISTWHSMHGEAYDFYAHPFIQPACRVLSYDPRPDRASTFSDKGVLGYALEPALDHHRANVVLVVETGSLRITSSFSAHPRRAYQPGHNHVERLAAAMSEIAITLHRAEAAHQIDPTMSANITQQLAGLREYSAPLAKLRPIDNGLSLRPILTIIKRHPLSLSLNPNRITATDISMQKHDKQSVLRRAREEAYKKVPDPVPPVIAHFTSSLPNMQRHRFALPSHARPLTMVNHRFAPPPRGTSLQQSTSYDPPGLTPTSSPFQSNPLSEPMAYDPPGLSSMSSRIQAYPVEELMEEVYIATIEDELGGLSNVDMANLICHCTEEYKSQPFESLTTSTQHSLIYIGLARKQRTDDNPTFASVMRNPVLLQQWMPAIKAEIDGLIATGALIPCRTEDTIGQELLPILIQLKRKRLADQAGTIAKLKARACVNGKIEKDVFGMFKDPSTTFSPNCATNTFLLFIAVAVRRKWHICGTDITMAYVMANYNRKEKFARLHHHGQPTPALPRRTHDLWHGRCRTSMVLRISITHPQPWLCHQHRRPLPVYQVHQ